MDNLKIEHVEIQRGSHWLNISSFSVKKLVKNVHYFSHFLSLKKQVKNLKLLQHFFGLFQNFHLKNEKVVKTLQVFHLCFQ
jgi:hypothetical protein